MGLAVGAAGGDRAALDAVAAKVAALTVDWADGAGQVGSAGSGSRGSADAPGTADDGARS
jgi:hypothetical protein